MKNTAAAMMMTLIMSGCGNSLVQTTTAPFSPGTGDNPLDGATVSHGGVSYALSAPGTIGRIDGSDGSAMEFSKANYADLGFPLPVSVVTAKGDSVSVNLETNMLSATLNVPFIGAQTFDFPLDFGSLLAGGSLKTAAECGSAEASFDAFCELVDSSAEYAADEGVALALDAAVDYGVPEFALGIIEDTVRQFLDVPTSFCEAWSNGVPRGVCD